MNWKKLFKVLKTIRASSHIVDLDIALEKKNMNLQNLIELLVKDMTPSMGCMTIVHTEAIGLDWR